MYTKDHNITITIIFLIIIVVSIIILNDEAWVT